MLAGREYTVDDVQQHEEETEIVGASSIYSEAVSGARILWEIRIPSYKLVGPCLCVAAVLSSWICWVPNFIKQRSCF